MHIRYLQSFVTVVELGSLAEAARRLDLTPAAVAARVKTLEATLGHTLIQRAGRTVKPTEAGIQILDNARAVLRHVRGLHTLTNSNKSLGEFRLGVFQSAMTSVLPKVLKQLYAHFPDLSVLVATSSSIDLCKQVGSGDLDAAIVVEPQFSLAKSTQWQSFIEEPLVVVAPQKFAKRHPHELLETEPFIRYDRAVLGGQLADRYLRDQGIRVQQRIEIDGLMPIAALVEQGLGVALLPDWQPLWQSGMAISRIALPHPARAPVRRVGLVWDSRGPRSTLAKALLKEATKMFAKTHRQSTHNT